MRKRMKELAAGMIDYGKPLLRFSTDKVELEVLEGQTVSGEFRIEVLSEQKVRGGVYTTGMRMNCLTPQFDGESATIRYEFHSEGLREGNIEKGYFYLVCNSAEYSLSFVVTVTRPYANGSLGRVRTLQDFQRLAAASWDEASKIYASSVFRSLFREENRRERLLYEVLSGTPYAGNSMNEFLVASGRKEAGDFEIKDKRVFFPFPESDVKEAIPVTATGFGELTIGVTADHPAIELVRDTIVRLDFNGSTFDFPFLIRRDLLHAGENLAVLTFRTITREEKVVLEIRRRERTGEEEAARERVLEIAHCRIRLSEEYLAYRLKRIVTGEWAKNTVDICRHLEALAPGNPWYTLMQAQAFLVNKQKQEARWILDAYRKEATDHSSPVYGYFLYLCTLSERESSYVDKVTEEIEEIYHQHPDSLILFWTLLFLREDYCENDAKRLDAIRRVCSEGVSSPFLYMEAYYQMWMDPHALERLEEFEIRVLLWAARRNALSKDLALQIGSLADSKREYDPLLYRLLCMTYDAFPRDDLVRTVCAYLIRTEHISPRYFYWFERGIELNLRITGLAEGYLLSMDLRSSGDLPKVIQMYFQYSSSLPKEKQAELFARITKEKKQNPMLYQEYRRSMEHFALGEMRESNISEDLAVVYDDLLREGLLNSEIAASMENIMFTYLATCPNPEILYLIIRQEELKEEQRVPVRKGRAYFRLYTNHYSIAVEDTSGRRYSALTAELTINRLMNPGKYLLRVMELAPGRLPYALHHISGKEKFRESLSGERDNLRLLMSSDRITDEYKLRLCPLLVRLYDDYSDPEDLSAYLRIIDGRKLPAESRVELTELLIEKKMYTEAYQMIRQFGMELLDAGRLVPLISYRIEENDYAEDDFLLSLTMEAFKSQKYNDIMLTYLCRHYNGPTGDMEMVYRAAGEFEIDTFDLSERILAQALFAAHLTPGVQTVFQSYARSGGRQLILEAYFNYFSYIYFVKDAVAPEEILEEMLLEFKDGADLTEIERLALLRYCAEEKAEDFELIPVMDELLSDFLEKEMYFQFYRLLPERLLEKYQLYDKTFLEFRTDPKKRVRLHFALSEAPEEYVTEELQNMYGGIFVRQFVLFFGESVQYYITEEDEGTEKVVLSDEIVSSDVFGEQKETRFDLLNEMMLHSTLKEETELLRSIKNYEAKKQAVRRNFKPL